MVVGGVSGEQHFVTSYGEPGSPLSPRMAWQLWAAAVMLADLYGEQESWETLRLDLPPLALPVADTVWMARFARTFDAIATRLAEGRSDPVGLTSCTGEEMALHLVIDYAETWLKDDVLTTLDSLPVDAERDDDFEGAREALFRDHDVLMLFDPALDGVDDPEGALHEHFRFANLHPSRWFLPFADQAE